MCFVGVLFVAVGQRTARKLRSLRKSMYTKRQLKQMFERAAIDGDHGVDVVQFGTLASSLGLDMTRRETEAAFSHIRGPSEGGTGLEKMTFDEFHAWWDSSTDADEELGENALVFV